MQLFHRDRAFLKQMMQVALPVSVQNLIATSINMADTVMISSLGDASIAAVGLVNQFVFFFMVICFGICSAGAVFYAQYFGSGDTKNVRRFLSIAIQFTVVVSVVFMAVSLLFPTQILRWLIPDETVIQAGTAYLQIIALTFLFMGISMTLNTLLRSVNRANEPLRVSIVAFVTNVVFNYLFIFGVAGFPKLGVAGAAVGTLIARTLEIILLIVLLTRRREGIEPMTPIGLWAWNRKYTVRYFGIAAPIILAETLWSFGQLLFAAAFARIGKSAAAGMQLTATIQNVFFIMVNSLAAAAAVMIGHSIGGNKPEQAYNQSRYFVQLTVTVGLLSTAVLVLLPDALLAIYQNLDPDLHALAVRLLIIRGAFITLRFLNGMLFVGIMRAGGDTRVPMLFEMATMWVFAIPATFFCVLVLHWPIEWVFILMSTEELVKVFLMLPRYFSKKWMRNITAP